MTDPLDALREPVTPVEPDPLFATRLRARLERALLDPRGATMTSTETSTPSGPGARQGDVGYASLWVPDVERAATFYASVLGWEYAPGSGPQGRQVRDVTPPLGLWGGQDRGTVFLCFVVDDVTEAVRRVRDAGGRADEPTQEPYGRIANCTDDQGMPFAVYQQPESPAVPVGPPRPGGLAYLTIEVADSARARGFYGAVLGWRFTPGTVEDGWSVRLGQEEVSPMTGMHGGHELPTVVPMYAVDDVAAAVARVRAAGGSATDPERMPYGITADCADDQGTRFYLGQF
jgi:uncharacterized protein